MKILIMQPYLSYRGGVDRVILNIAKHYNATIYTLEYNKNASFPEFKELDVKLFGKEVSFSNLLPHRASQGLRYGYNFYNAKIKEDYDVINAHISPSEWIRHRNGRVLWYCHTPPREVYDLYAVRMRHRTYREKFLYSAMAKTYKLIAHRVVKKIEVIATNSEVTRKRINKYYSRDATVINPGIDYKSYYCNEDGKFFFYPSRIVINKRQDYVINAFKRFLSKTKRKDYRLVLAGTLSKDPEHMAYYDNIRRMANGLKVEIKTNISDKEITELYSKATAVLFSAINEDYGLIPLEAMASSKPVISVNEGGPRYTIVAGKTGFLVNSEAEMAAKMEFVVGHKDLAENMGREGRTLVERRYTWGAFFKRFDAALREASKRSE